MVVVAARAAAKEERAADWEERWCIELRSLPCPFLVRTDRSRRRGCRRSRPRCRRPRTLRCSFDLSCLRRSRWPSGSDILVEDSQEDGKEERVIEATVELEATAPMEA